MTVGWFIWHGETFKVPLSTLCRSKDEGGWGLIHPVAKCSMLLLLRMQELRKRRSSISADWMQRWDLLEKSENPPRKAKAPSALGYVNQYYREMAYIPPKLNAESMEGYRRRMYGTLLHYIKGPEGRRPMRVEIKWPQVEWKKVWRNLHATPLQESTAMAWYKAIHDILPTNERRFKIKLSPVEACTVCGERDTLLHRIVECGEGRTIWDWVRSRIATMLRTEPGYILESWLLWPHIDIWPLKRGNGVMWILATTVHFRLNERRTLTLQDFFDFLMRQRWKICQSRKGKRRVANYLIVIEDAIHGQRL
jgi:hypothetical protein